MEKEIIILAKSSKHGEYCIAGVDTTTGEWIRPISDNIAHEGSVPLCDIMYEDGTQLQILDKVKIKILSCNPTNSQPENCKYDSSVRWRKTGKSTLSELINSRGYDNPEKIFYNGNKEVLEEEVCGQPSLLFLNVKNPTIFIKTFDGNKRIQFNFQYNGINYNFFKISDERIKSMFANKHDGSYYLGKNLSLILSLTDRYYHNGTYKHYKMVAHMFY